MLLRFPFINLCILLLFEKENSVDFHIQSKEKEFYFYLVLSRPSSKRIDLLENVTMERPSNSGLKLIVFSMLTKISMMNGLDIVHLQLLKMMFHNHFSIENRNHLKSNKKVFHGTSFTITINLIEFIWIKIICLPFMITNIFFTKIHQRKKKEKFLRF